MQTAQKTSKDKFKVIGLNFTELSNNSYKITHVFRKLAIFPFRNKKFKVTKKMIILNLCIFSFCD